MSCHPKSNGDVAVEVPRLLAQQPAQPCSPGAGSPRSHLAFLDVWHSLSLSSKALGLSLASACIIFAAYAAAQLSEGWHWGLLQDTLLILCSAVLTLVLLLDAFARENAYQLLASLGLSLLTGSQLAVFLATARQRSSSAAAVGAVCLAMQTGAMVLARPAYRSFGWRMYSRLASNWRLGAAERQRQRRLQLRRQRLSATAKVDAVLLALLVVVAAVNAANPGASAEASQPQTVWLLVGTTAAGAPLLAGWLLAACWEAAAVQQSPLRRRVAALLDLLYPISYVPPLVIIFAGASKGGQLAQPHAEAYLIIYPLLFLAARTATWWCARQLSTARLDAAAASSAHCSCERSKLQRQLGATAGGSGGGAGQAGPAVPSELLPLLRGAWLLKLPSSIGAAAAPEDAAAAGPAADKDGCSGAFFPCPGSGGCSACGALGSAAAAPGCGARRAPRQRFFQLSEDGACLRWSWDRWVLLPHVQAIHCCDESLTIRLALLLEPDLRLRFASWQQYTAWTAGLRLLLAMLLRPDGDLLQRRSAPGCLAHGCSGRGEGGSELLGSGGTPADSRKSSSFSKEVVLDVWPATPAAAGAEPAAAAAAAGAAAGRDVGEGSGGTQAEIGSIFRKMQLTCSTGRVCDRSDSQQQLKAAAARSQASLTAAAGATVAQQQQQQLEQQQHGPPAGQPTEGKPSAQALRRASTIQLVASAVALPDLAAAACHVSRQPSSSSEGAVPAESEEQHKAGASQRSSSSRHKGQPKRPRWQRLRSAFALPAHFWRGSGGTVASGAGNHAGTATAGANGSPSRQPLRGPLNPSSSSGDLLGAAQQQAEPQQQQQQQAEQGQEGKQPSEESTHHERVPTLGFWAEQPQQQQQQLPSQQQQQHQHQLVVPPLDLGQLAAATSAQGIASRGASQPAAASAGTGGGEQSVASAVPRGHEELSAAAYVVDMAEPQQQQQLASIPCGRRGLLRGPFIHLRLPVSSAVPPCQQPAQDPGIPPYASAAATRQDSLPTAGLPSIAGSETSTPAHASRGGSPQRGSPNRQQQLRTFQLYLQQQLHLQQQGRHGPLGDHSTGGSGVGSGCFSGASSPPQEVSPGRKASDASLLSWNASQEAVLGSQSSSSSDPAGLAGTVGTAAATSAAAVGPSPAVAASGPAGQQAQRSSSASAAPPGRQQQQQQQFSARMQNASSMGAGQAESGAAAWGGGAVGGALSPASAEGNWSAQPTWLPAFALGSGPSLLERSETGFSSWGLPTPTTATARTPFNGLSRFNSLAPSLSHTPLSTFRQHPAFAFSHPSQHAHPALLAQQYQQQPGLLPAQQANPWAGTAASNGGGVSGAWGAAPTAALHPRSRRQTATAAAASSAAGRRAGEGEEGEQQGDEVGSSPEGTAAASTPNVLSPMSIVGGLGISVPVEMVAFSDLMFGKLLGEGSEGAVYAAWYRETPVAVKRTSCLMELEMNLHAGSHDNIVQLRGLCSHGGGLYLIMELCPRGTLDVLIHRGHLQHTGGGAASAAMGAAAGPAAGSHRLDPVKLLPIVRSVARGMLHLHTRRPAIFHRDLKPGNLFLGHGGVVKVGDFGMSRYAESWRQEEEGEGMLERTLTPGVIGTAAYSAPELLNPDTPTAAERRSGGCTEYEQRILKADVFAFGVTLWEILERKRPFAGMDGFQIQTQWYLNPESMRLPRPTVPDSTLPAARLILETLAGLVESCTRWDPDARPTFQDILSILRSCSAPSTGAGIGRAGTAAVGSSVTTAAEAVPPGAPTS